VVVTWSAAARLGYRWTHPAAGSLVPEAKTAAGTCHPRPGRIGRF
jgi:hypothetical protein